MATYPPSRSAGSSPRRGAAPTPRWGFKAIALAAIGGFFLLMVPFGAWAAWYSIANAKASVGWPTAPGTITRSEVEPTVKNRVNPKVAYTYAVNGKTMTGSRVSYRSEGGSNQTDAQAVVDRFPMGKSVQVHYDPALPTNSVLEPGASASTYGYLVIPLILGGFGLFMFAYGRSVAQAG